MAKIVTRRRAAPIISCLYYLVRPGVSPLLLPGVSYMASRPFRGLSRGDASIARPLNPHEAPTAAATCGDPCSAGPWVRTGGAPHLRLCARRPPDSPVADPPRAVLRRADGRQP